MTVKERIGMGLANCRNCGRLFNQVARDICPLCIREEEEQFLRVRDYLKENRYASTYEVSEATEVPLDTIIRFIREGRLTIVDTPNLTYPCERCHKLISKGRFCPKCAVELQKELESAKESVQAPETRKRGRYYFKS
jgi:flagellar operon protein (TIGR03826 family)